MMIDNTKGITLGEFTDAQASKGLITTFGKMIQFGRMTNKRQFYKPARLMRLIDYQPKCPRNAGITGSQFSNKGKGDF